MDRRVDKQRREEMRLQFQRLWLLMVVLVVAGSAIVLANSESQVVTVGTLIAAGAVILGGAGALVAMRTGKDE